MQSLCKMLLMWNFWLLELWISKSWKFLLKLRVHHSGKFAPREITHYTTILIFISAFSATREEPVIDGKNSSLLLMFLSEFCNLLTTFMHYTVYVKSFEVEKFRTFRTSSLNYETFPPNLLLHIYVWKVSKDPLRNFYSESSLTW